MMPVDISIFKDQLEAVLTDLSPDAVKVGMIPSRAHLETLWEMLVLHKHGPIVFDPIGAPSLTSYSVFNADWWDDLSVLVSFMNEVDLITPNLNELDKLMLNIENHVNLKLSEISAIDDLQSESIFKMDLVRRFYGMDNLLLTGGHNPDNDLHTDILMCSPPKGDFVEESTRINDDDLDSDITMQYEGKEYDIYLFKGENVMTPNTHGTGCIYSSAITSLLAKGETYPTAIGVAKRLVSLLLKSGKDWRLYEDSSACGPAYSILPQLENNDTNHFDLNILN